MRLLNASKLTMHEFLGSSIPKYAILSHRWENEEVAFQDFRDGKGPRMAGWSKVTGCCAQALLDGWKYVVSNSPIAPVVSSLLFLLDKHWAGEQVELGRRACTAEALHRKTDLYFSICELYELIIP